MKEQLVPLFRDAGVRLVFSGHEHNYQRWEQHDISYIVTGAAGGKLRGEPIDDTRRRPSDFGAWLVSFASAHHHLRVTLSPEEARVTPVGVGGGTVAVKGDAPAEFVLKLL